jgi:hypothetical protein
MPFLWAGKNVYEWSPLQDILSLKLRHASHNADHQILSLDFMPFEFPQSGVNFLDGLFPDAACVQDDDVRLGRIIHRFHPAIPEVSADFLGIELVHLAAKSFDQISFHINAAVIPSSDRALVNAPAFPGRAAEQSG